MMRWLVVFLHVDADGDEAGLFHAIEGPTALGALAHVTKRGDAPKTWHYAQAIPWPEGANDTPTAMNEWAKSVGWT